MYNYLGVAYIVEPATSEMKALIVKDKIPAVSKNLTFIPFSLPLYHVSSHFSLTSLSPRQAEAAKKVNEKMIKKKKKKKMMMTKKDMIVIVEEDEKKEDENEEEKEDEKKEDENEEEK